MQGLLDELDHNLTISGNFDGSKVGFLFKDEQLAGAIREGVLSTVDDELRQSISNAYGAISRANETTNSYFGRVKTQMDTMNEINRTIPLIEKARNELLKFVRSEDSVDDADAEDD